MVFQGSYDLRRDVDKLKNKTDELAKDYFIQVNSPIITYLNETYTPSSVSATAYESSREITDLYDGILKLEVSTDGGITYENNPRIETGHTITQLINRTDVTNYRVTLYDTDNNYLDSQTITIVRTAQGGTGKGYDFAYYTTATAPASAPVGDVVDLTGDYDEWLQRPKDVDSTHTNIFMSLRVSDTEGEWGTWSTPVKYSGIGERGEDGEGLEMIFCRTETPDGYSLNPHSLDPVQTDDYKPTGWSDDQQGVNSQYQYEYVCMRTKELPNNSKVAQWGKFTEPKLWATYSEDGEDAITVMLGNEAQLIAVDSNGNLKENPTIVTIPVYCYKGISRVAGSISLGGVSNTFSQKNATNPTASNDGTITLRCTSVPNQITRNEPIAITVQGKTFTKYFTWNKIGDGQDGNEGGTFDYVYYTTSSPNAPTISDTTTTIDPNTNRNQVDTWCARPTNVNETNQYCYGAYFKKVNGEMSGGYSDVFLWMKYGATGQRGPQGIQGIQGPSGGDGQDGEDGIGYQYAYKTSSTEIQPSDKPTGDVDATSGYVWSKVPVPMDASHQYMYISYRTVKGSIKGDWSDSALWSKYGQDGTDGSKIYETSTQIPTYSNASYPERKYRLNLKTISEDINIDDINNADIFKWDTYFYPVIAKYKQDENSWWVYFGERTDLQGVQGIQGPQGLKGDDGKDGAGLEHIFYRTNTKMTWGNNDTNPAKWDAVQEDDYVKPNTGWTDNAQGVTNNYKYEYCAIRTKSVPDGSTTGEWSKFNTPILWSTYSAGLKSVTNYYLASSKSSGVDTTEPNWTDNPRSSYATMTETNQYLWNYEVVRDEDDVIKATTTPVIIGRYGQNGTEGVGIDDIEEYYAKSSSNDVNNPPQNWYTTPQTTDTTNRYLWNYQVIVYSNGDRYTSDARVIGTHGATGTRGTGAVNITTQPTANTTTIDGYTVYHNIDLGTAKTQSGLSQILVGDYLRYSYYIYPIIYIKNNTIYTSQRISVRGQDGAGGKSITRVVNYYLATSYSTGVTRDNDVWGNWTTTIQTINATKQYLWNYEKSYNGNTENDLVSTTDPVIIGRFGTTGNGISTVVEEYALTTDTTQPTSWSTEIPVMTSTYKYLWNKETTNYTNGNSDVSIKIIGVYGDTGEDGADGNKIYEITTQPPTYNNSSYPNRKYRINLKSLTEDIDIDTVNFADIFKWTTYFYPVIATYKQDANTWWVYFGERTDLQGEQGPQGIQGIQGVAGEDGSKIYEIPNPPSPYNNAQNPSFKYRISWANLGDVASSLKEGDVCKHNTYFYQIANVWTNNFVYFYERTNIQGPEGERGDDGIGMEQIFRRTANDTAPQITNGQGVEGYSGTDRNGKHYQDDDFLPDNWEDDPQGVTETLPYEWVCQRVKTPNSTTGVGEWGNFTPPTLWNNYSFKGNTGDQGPQGDPGRDGTELTGAEIMTKITGESIDAQSVGGLSPSDLLTTALRDSQPQMDSQNSGSYRVIKMGRLCVLSLNNYRWTASTTTANQTVFTLPDWAKPISTHYFQNTPHGDALSITAEGYVRITPLASNERYISGTVTYIADDGNRLTPTIDTSHSSSTVYVGSSYSVYLLDNTGEPMEGYSLQFKINGGTYTKRTDSNGKASLNINLNEKTYPLDISFGGDTTFNNVSTSVSLTVQKRTNVIVRRNDDHSAEVIVEDSEIPIPNLSCKVNIGGVFYYVTSDYEGILDFTSILKEWKGTVTATVYNNNTNMCTFKNSSYGIVNLAGTKTSQDYTQTFHPSSVSGSLNNDYSEKNGTYWNYATVGALTNKDDGAYAITDILSSGLTAGPLYVLFNTGLSTTAKIKTITVYIKYASLQGWVSASKGSYNANESRITMLDKDDNQISIQKNFVVSNLNQGDVNTWYEVGYQWDGLSLSNSGSAYNTIKVRITDLLNGGGGYNNNSRFGIDYVQLILTYED